MSTRLQRVGLGILACMLTVGALAAAKTPTAPPKEHRALTILDRHCPELVKPFDVGDNLQRLGEMTLEDAARDATNQLQQEADKRGMGGVFKSVKGFFHHTSSKPAGSAQADGSSVNAGQTDSTRGASGQATTTQTSPGQVGGGQADASQAGSASAGTSVAPAGQTNAAATTAKAAGTAAGILQSAQGAGILSRLPIPGASIAGAVLNGIQGAKGPPGSALTPIPSSPQMAAAQVAAGAIRPGGTQQPSADTPGAISDDLRRAMKDMNWLPHAAEVEFGRRDHQSQLDDVVGRESKEGKRLYPIADTILHDILKGIDQPTDYDFQLFILKSDDHNAIARPGGYLYVDAGLLKNPKLRPKAEFAIGHEVGHVLQRHETRELQALIVDSFAIRKDIMDTIAKMHNDPASVLERVRLNRNQYIRYHMDQELEADSCSARLLGHAYGDPHHLAESLNAFLVDLPAESAPITTVKTASPGGPANTPIAVAVASTTSMPPADQTTSAAAIEAQKTTAVAEDIVSTPGDQHPSSKERAQNLKEMYQEVRGQLARLRIRSEDLSTSQARRSQSGRGLQAMTTDGPRVLR